MQFSFQCRLPGLNRFALIFFVSDHAPGGTFFGLAGEIPLSDCQPTMGRRRMRNRMEKKTNCVLPLLKLKNPSSEVHFYPVHQCTKQHLLVNRAGDGFAEGLSSRS